MKLKPMAISVDVRSTVQAGILACAVLFAGGCGSATEDFAENALLAKRFELTDSVDMQQPLADASLLLRGLLGTPDAPHWPLASGDSAGPGIVDLERLRRAAGAVRSDEVGQHYGLFREHCVVCHGTTGDGLGPSAGLLNPYPRDFRHGKFKFKSTPIGHKPTRRDLQTLLVDGIPGTSMPSFGLLASEDLDALVDYVIYLSVRGQVERQLLTEAALDLDIEAGERLFDPAWETTEPAAFEEARTHALELAASIGQQWEEATEFETSVPDPPADLPVIGLTEVQSADQQAALAESIRRGKLAFQGSVAACAFCHGMDARGDGQQNNYDEWTREWAVLAGLDPRDKSELAPMLELGALKPRNILPRNLNLGAFRGGGSAAQLYVRIVNGIEGTPMPAAPLKPSNPQGLEVSQVWDLVNYLLSLSDAEAATADQPESDADGAQASTFHSRDYAAIADAVLAVEVGK